MKDLAGLPARWPKLTVALYVLVAAISCFGLTRLQQEEDLLVFLPTDNPDVRRFRDTAHRFGGLRVALIGVEAPAGKDVFSTEAVQKIKQASDAIKNVQGVDRLVSLTNVADVQASAAGAEVTQLVQAIPQGAAESKALRDKVLSREHIVGSMVSRDGRASLIVVFLAEHVSDRQVTNALRDAALRTLSPYAVYFGGAPFAAASIYSETQADVRRLSPLALCVLLLVVVFSFRDPVGVVLTVSSVAFSVLVVLGGMGLWGEKFTVASSTLPVILFASGSSYAVHVLGRYYLVVAHKPPNEAIREALAIVGPPLLIAAGTTSVGFFSFVATDVRPMRSFGIACGTGVLLCWLTSLTLVPAVVALWPRQSKPQRTVSVIGDWLVSLWHWSKRRRVLVIVACAAVAIALARPMLKVSVRMEPSSFFRPGSEPWQAERFLEDRFGGAHFLQVAVHGDLDDPASLREVDRLVAYASALPGVTQVNAITQPLRLVNEVMGGGARLPSTTGQATNLYFFLEGEAGISQLLASGRQDALLQIRVRGDARPALEALETFCAGGLRVHPVAPTPDDVAERVTWTVRAQTGREVSDPARLKKMLHLLAQPTDRDEEWSRKRADVVKAFLDSEEAPPMDAARRAQIVELAVTGGDWAGALKAAVPAEDGAMALGALTGIIADARRDLAVERALPHVIEATGQGSPDGPLDPALAKKLRPIVDDLFLPKLASQPREPLSAKVAGEPILDRGFSRSVDDNQRRSLGISVVAVLLMLLVLFRSVVQAVVCMVPSLLTMVILFGVMGLRGIHIDLGTSLIAGLATGAGSDFAMHYLWYLRRQSADDVSRSVGPVMVVSIVLVSLGFVVLSFGRSPVMQLFGTLAGAAMSLAAFLTCLLVPALLNKVGAGRGPSP